VSFLANAGIQGFREGFLDSGLRRNDAGSGMTRASRRKCRAVDLDQDVIELFEDNARTMIGKAGAGISGSLGNALSFSINLFWRLP
jgi:hypothetical protein